MRYLLLVIFAAPVFAQFGAAKSVVHGFGVPNSALCANANNVGRVYARQDGAAAGSTFYVCANTAASTYAWELAGTGGGGTGAAPYDAAVAAQTTLTVAAATHLQGTAPIAMCFDGTTPFVASACSYTRATNGDIVFTWSPAFTGRVTIIGGGTGATGATGATGPTGPTGAATFTADARTTTTEALVSADCGQAVTFSNAGAIAASLPASPLADGCVIAVKNIGAGDVTITPVSGTISGAAAVTVSLGEMGWITSNGTNYEFLTTRMLAGTGMLLTKARISTTATVDTATILTRATDQAGTDKSCVSSTGNNTATCSLTPTLTAYTANSCFQLAHNFTNTTTLTLNIDGLGAKSVLRAGGVALNYGDIRAGDSQLVCLDSTATNFELNGQIRRLEGTNGYECYEEFLGVVGAQGAYGACNFWTAVSGTGAAISGGTGEADAPGILTASTGTTTTGAASTSNDTESLLFGGATHTYTVRIRIPTLSTAGERFYIQTGWLDTNTITPVDGCYLRVQDSVNGGEWEAVCRSNSTETAVDTNVLPVANTWETMRIEVNAAASSVAFTINGTTVATITTNIPSGAGRNTGLRPVSIVKSAGTTARTVNVDWLRHQIQLTTAR